jgi:hypothetical protein
MRIRKPLPTGCAVRCPGALALRAHVAAMACSEEAIVTAMRMTWGG